MLRGVKVLLVDDDEDTLDLFKTVLEMSGAEVVAAESVDAALAFLEWFVPNVIASDTMIPSRGGFELLDAIRVRSPHGRARIPAIAITGSAFARDVARSLAGGFDMHLSKPVEPRTLVAAVARLAYRPGPADTC